MDPVTAGVLVGGAGVAKGVSGYKAGQASGKKEKPKKYMAG